jgi:intein/homing endonuclease
MISLEWLAGFFDGEGYIGIAAQGKRHFQLTVEITQTNLPVIEEIQKQFGGYVYTKRIKTLNTNTCWIVRFGAKEGLLLLEKLLPYLKIKKTQAEYVLSHKADLLSKSNFKLSDDEVRMRQQIRLGLAALKPYSKILAQTNQIN